MNTAPTDIALVIVPILYWHKFGERQSLPIQTSEPDLRNVKYVGALSRTDEIHLLPKKELPWLSNSKFLSMLF